MTRINPIDPQSADPATAATLEAVRNKFGMLPNLVATLAHAPAALQGYLGLSETVAGGRLSPRQREEIALAVAQENGCLYCLSAHTAIARNAGIDDDGIAAARSGSGPVARFAQAVTRARGMISNADFAAARDEGLDDALMVEIVANVALNVLTNTLNNLAGTEVDFPLVELATAA